MSRAGNGSGKRSPYPRGFPRRGEIYWTREAMPGGKPRPVLVVSNETGNRASGQVIVAALSTQIPDKRYKTNVHLGAGDPLPQPGVILCASLYTLRQEDLGNYRAALDPHQLEDVDAALRSALSLR